MLGGGIEGTCGALQQFLHINCLFECSGARASCQKRRSGNKHAVCVFSGDKRPLVMSVRFVPSFWFSVSLTLCLLRPSVCSRANGVGLCAHFAFKVAWPRCGRAPLACGWCRAAQTGVSRARCRSCRGYRKHCTRLRHISSFPQILLRNCTVRLLVSAELHSSGVTFSGPGYRNFLFVLVRRGFQSLVKLKIFPQLSMLPRHLATDI